MKIIKKVFVSLFLVLFSVNSFSQNGLLKKSKEIPSNNIVNGLIGSDKTGFYVYRINDIGVVPHLYIEKRDIETLDVIYSKELEEFSKFQKMVRRANNNIQVFFKNNKVYCFYNYIDNQKDTMYTILQTVSSEGIVSDLYNVLKVKTRNTWASAKISFSPDNNYFIVSPNPSSAYINPFDLNDKPVVELMPKLYNSETLNMIWEKDITKYVNGKSYAISNLQIDNSGNLFFLINENTKAPVLSLVENSSPTLKQFPDLLSADYEYSCMDIILLSNNNIMFTGIKEDKIKKTKGIHSDPSIFVRIIDPITLTIKNSQDYNFSPDITSKLSDGRNKGKEEGMAFPHNQFNGSIIKEYPEGVFYIVQDVFYNVGKLSGAIQFKDVICFDIGKNGELKSSCIIPKYKNFLSWTEMDISVFLNGNEANIVLQENPSLENKKFNEYESNTMDGPDKDHHNIVIASFKNGQLIKKKLFSNDKSGIPFTPGTWVSETNEKIITVGEKKMILLLENTKKNQIQFASYSY